MAMHEPLTEAADAADLVPADHALTLRDPGVLTTIDELQTLRGAALEVLDARSAIVETARRRAIRMTHPEDWVLFKSPDGRITAYLQDAGCDRVRDVLGIEVFSVSKPEKIMTIDGGAFMYLITGSGRSRLTIQTVEAIEGGRSSGDDFCKGKTGAELELLVRKAARANLDGNITRELTGLKSVPIGELIACWEGTGKLAEHCRKGRGFGTGDERHGARREGVPDVEPPTCPVCKAPDGTPLPLVYRAAKGERKAFYGCPQFERHPSRRVGVDADEWLAKAAKRPAAPAGGEPITEREPGADG